MESPQDLKSDISRNDTLSSSVFSTFYAFVRDYEHEQSDQTSNALLKHLNDLSASCFTFNVDNANQRRFVSAIYKIMALVEGHHVIAWSSLTLIEKLSPENLSNRSVGYLQNLTPVISKLMPYALTEERKVRVLKVLQTLTYGMRIMRPAAYVGPLLVALVNWLRAENQNSVVQLSLSVLTNILHQNNVTLHTLMQIINLKEFMNDMLRLRCNIVCRMEVCKLMFLLEDLIFERPDDAEVTNFLKVSFCTVLETSSKGSKSSLQHCIKFFADMVTKKKIKHEILESACFFDSTKKVINQLEMGLETLDLECSMLLFKFLGILIGIRAPTFFTLYPAILRQGLAWVSKHLTKASEAMNTMHIILDSHDLNSDDVVTAVSLEDLEKVLLPLLSGKIIDGNNYFFQTALLNFLIAVLDIDVLKPAIKTYLPQKMIESFLEFAPVEIILCNYSEYEPIVKMHIYLLGFVSKVVLCCDGSWMTIYTSLLSDQRVISVLAVALQHGSSDLRAMVLSLIRSVGFSRESLSVLAKTMTNCASGELSISEQGDKSVCEDILNQSANNGTTPMEVNKLITHLKELHTHNKLHEATLAEVLQLYQYKDQVNADYQKSLLASLTNASVEKALLHDNIFASKQIISKLSQEIYCVRPALEAVREKYASALKTIEENEKEFKSLEIKMEQKISSCQNTIRTLNNSADKQEKKMKEYSEKIQSLKEQLVSKAEQFANIYESKEKLQGEKDGLLEQVKTLTEQMKEKEKALEKLNLQNADMTKEVERLESTLKVQSKTISELQEDKNAAKNEIETLKRIRDTVFELTGGGKKMF